ncbi:hypothetical protein JKP88DRAFT_249246 [Tribonema minus]|uniref:Kinesin light chain n=1 Tax=Tribonema minus TaxID=303371 RepID=A0A836C983_9STRA|nr:hypothetical protein JKP88DRAFT_249246 [Tribonema minus]
MGSSKPAATGSGTKGAPLDNQQVAATAGRGSGVDASAFEDGLQGDYGRRKAALGGRHFQLCSLMIEMVDSNAAATAKCAEVLRELVRDFKIVMAAVIEWAAKPFISDDIKDFVASLNQESADVRRRVQEIEDMRRTRKFLTAADILVELKDTQDRCEHTKTTLIALGVFIGPGNDLDSTGPKTLPFFLQRVVDADKLVGRDDLVKEIKDKLASNRAVVLYGGPGEGKSTVAMEVAEQLVAEGGCSAGTFKVDMTALIVQDASGEDIKADVRAHIGGALYRVLVDCEGGITQTNAATTTAQQQWDAVSVWLRCLKPSSKQVLLAVENAEYATTVNAAEGLADVLEEIRQFTSTLLLVASRENSALYRKFETVQAKPLTPQYAAQMIRSKCTMTDDQARTLLDHCGCNSLMMEVVSSFLGTHPDKLSDVMSAVKQQQPLPMGRKAGLDHQVDKLFGWLKKFLEEDARQLLARLSVFASGFSTDGARAVMPHAASGGRPLQDLLEELCDISIIRQVQAPAVTKPDSARYRMHSISHLAAAKLLPAAEQQPIRDAFAQHILGLAKELHRLRPATGAASLLPAMALLSAELPNIRRLLMFLDNEASWQGESWAIKLANLGDELRALSVLMETEALFRRALALEERALDARHPAMATLLNKLALLLQAQGKLVEAEPLYRRALTIREEALGAEHPHSAQSLGNLAGLLRAQGKFAEAEPLYRRALAIREHAWHRASRHGDIPQQPRWAAARSGQAGGGGAGQIGRGRATVSARAGHQRAGARRSSSRYCDSAQQPRLAAARSGKLAEAELLHRRALAIREDWLGAEHPDTATSLNNFAKLLQVQDRLAEAEPLHRRALAIWEEALGAKHPHAATSLNNLAELLQAQGKLVEAEPLYWRALAIREVALGAEHPDTAMLRIRLAGLLRLKKDGGGAVAGQCDGD